MDNDPLSLTDIKLIYQQAADIVAMHGEAYLPIFERIEREYKSQMKNRDVLTRAIQISKSKTVD